MQSILIASKDKEKALDFARKIAREDKVHDFDFTTIEVDTLGIDDVRNFQKKAYLKPLKSLKKIVFLTANDLTLESQNALLKILEEPPDNTIIILHVPDKNLLLPTILSRCNVFELKSGEQLSKQDISEYLNILVSLKDKGVGGRLKIAQDLSKDKTEALIYIENLILSGRNSLKDDPSLAAYLKSLQKSHTIIKTTNVNLRLALENLFLNL